MKSKVLKIKSVRVPVRTALKKTDKLITHCNLLDYSGLFFTRNPIHDKHVNLLFKIKPP